MDVDTQIGVLLHKLMTAIVFEPDKPEKGAKYVVQIFELCGVEFNEDRVTRFVDEVVTTMENNPLLAEELQSVSTKH